MQASKYNLITKLAAVALFFIVSSCVQEYTPKLTTSEQQLVVDGKISNFPGPYTVKLSSSSDLNDLTETPVTSATVVIVDLDGNQETLTETSPGIYKTSINGIQGVVGQSYKIKIDLSNGKHYESKFEEILSPVGVENVYAEEGVQEAQNNIESDVQGFQFYVDSKQASSSKTYFYWQIEETYEYHSDYRIVYYYDGSPNDSTLLNPLGFSSVENRDTLFYCWKTQLVPELFSFSTEYLSTPTVSKFPIHFVPFRDERLQFKYSILVKQYTISEDAYIFLDKLKQQNSNQDAMFSSQPFQIRGNVSNTEDQTEPVLGYFMAMAGTNGPRVFTQAPSGTYFDRTKCDPEISISTIQYIIATTPSSELPLYFTLVELGAPLVLAYVRQDCLDCERQGGIALKPEFWE